MYFFLFLPQKFTYDIKSGIVRAAYKEIFV